MKMRKVQVPMSRSDTRPGNSRSPGVEYDPVPGGAGSDRDAVPGYDDITERSPRVDGTYTSTRFRNPNLNNREVGMDGVGREARPDVEYRGNPKGGRGSGVSAEGKERGASPGDEYGVSDTMKVPDRSNSETGYLRPRNAEASGKMGPSGRSLHDYALSRTGGPVRQR
jgi:hypothetical protein